MAWQHEIIDSCKRILQQKLHATLKYVGPSALAGEIVPRFNDYARARVNIALEKTTLNFQPIFIMRDATAIPLVRWDLSRDPQGARTKPLVLARYVRELVGMQFRKTEVDYVDTVGNISLTGLGVQIWHHGAKPAPERVSPSRLASRRSAQLLTILLCRPELLNQSYRRLATASGISLASVAQIITALKAAFLLDERHKGQREFTGNINLFDLWITVYQTKWKPRAVLRKCQLPRETPLENLLSVVKNFPVLVSGELAVAAMVDHIQPQTAGLMVKPGDEGQIMQKLRLAPSPGGNIELIGFPGEVDLLESPDFPGRRLAHPFIVYADALSERPEIRLAEALGKLGSRFVHSRLRHGE